MRSVRQRFTDIQKEYLQKNRTDESSSGTSNDITDLDRLLEDIKKKEKAAEENNNNDKDKTRVEADRAKAEEARRVDMERTRQTKKRQKVEGEDHGERKQSRRRSGGDTLEYLREKCEMEKNIDGENVRDKKGRARELGYESRRATKSDARNDLQQQQQNQNMQTLLLHQQQQQSQALMALITSRTKKTS